MKSTSLLKTALLACLALAGPAKLNAGSFSTDFNSGVPPAGAQVFGTALTLNHTSGGVGNSGVLKLTINANDQQSSMIIGEIDPGETIAGFDATWMMRVGGGSGTPADGVSFAFGTFNDGVFSEEGPGTIQGLSVAFDIYNNSGGEAPAIDLKWNGVEVATRKFPIATLRSGTAFWPIKVHVDPDGTLDLVYNNNVIYTNFPISVPQTGARFGFGARTGGLNENQWIDDLNITTTVATGPYVKTLSPVGTGASAEGAVMVQLVDFITQIDASKIQLFLNDAAVTPNLNKVGDITTVSYNTPGLLDVGSTNSVRIVYVDTNNATNETTYTFIVGPYTTVPVEYAVTGVDITKPGFGGRIYQMPIARGPTDANSIANAERALGRGFINPDSGEPFANIVDETTAPGGTFVDPDVINWSVESGRGNFQFSSTPSMTDEAVPGIPSALTFSTDNFVTEFLFYLELKAGVYRLGVNSDDGFKLSTSPGVGNVTGLTLASFNGGRGSSDTTGDVRILQDGVYPFRLLWWEGGGDSNVELFHVNPDTGIKELINDLTLAGPIKAFREASGARPYVSRVTPENAQYIVFPTADVSVDITDGVIPMDLGSATVLLDGAPLTVSTVRTGSVTTLTKAGSPASSLSPGLHSARVVFTYNENGATVSSTNDWSFTVPMHGVVSAASKVDLASVAGAGFKARVHQLARTANTTQGDSDRFPGEGNRMPRMELQLAGAYYDTATGDPFPNVAIPDPADSDFVYDVIGVINMNMGLTGTAPNRTLTTPNSGHFAGNRSRSASLDEALPGLGAFGATERATLSNGGLDNYVAEFTTYLDLKAGSYLFGVNSDDRYVAISAPDPHDTLGTLLGFFNGGGGDTDSDTLPLPSGSQAIVPGSNTGNAIFGMVVPEDGIYPVRVLYWQGGGGVNLEFYQIREEDGAVALVNDFNSPWPVLGYSTYTGPARAYVKYPVTPTPWDYRQQEAGPGLLKYYARTPNSVDSADIYNWVDTARPFADVAIGGVFANAAGKTISMRLNGAPVAPTILTTGSDTVVSFKPAAPLPSNSTNTATLIYEGSTNSWTFAVQVYTNVDASAAVPLGTAQETARGFRAKVVQSSAGRPGGNTVAAAEAQLAGSPADIAIPGPEADGSYLIPDIINWSDRMNTGGNSNPIGNFQSNALAGWPFPMIADVPVPGIPGTGVTHRDNIAAEIFAYLAFPTAGYYKLGVNGDDGWAVSVATPGVTTGTVLFTIDRGAGSADIPFSFTVPEPGLYPIRLVWYEGGGDGNLEFFSYGPNAEKIPINSDAANAIKAYHSLPVVARPEITSVTISAGTITILWTGGGTLESSPVLGSGAVWTTTGDSDGSFSEPTSGSAKFYRVKR